MKKHTLFVLWTLLTLLALLLSGCASGSAANAAVATETDASEMFTDRDKETDYDEANCVRITLEGDSAACDSAAVEISASTVTITGAGEYLLTGTLTDGQIVVNAEKTDKVRLILNGVDIHSENSAAIYVAQADKVFITLAEDTKNTLSNGGRFENADDTNIDAAVFSKDDLTLNGTGALTITSPAGHGVVSKDDLVVTGGVYEIVASGHGLSGKDSVRVADGSFTITSGKDGVHAENADNASLGYLYVAGGDWTISAQGDGLSAAAYLCVDGGSFTVTCGGGAGTTSGARNAGFGQNFNAQRDTGTDTTSAKGLKADGYVLVNGGSITLDTADDGIHADGDVTIRGGTCQIASGDDGIHAGGQALVDGGSVDITQSYEGIEGRTVCIAGGEISLVASDDGLNAAGGNDQSGFGGFGGDNFVADSDASVEISGGTLNINAGGDGIDSNGSILVSGGETYISGPENSGNGALDCGTEATVTGGIIVAVGASGMAETFGSASTQGSILLNVNTQSAGSEVRLTDADGQTLIRWQAEKTFSSVVISCPELVQGATYTLSAGTYSAEITLNSLSYGASGGLSGNFPGGFPAERGNRGMGGAQRMH